jgi:crotonobetainyl-CoA:carnitine CoA-transferase CaiB-like acyl-CoA transferase
MLRLGPVATRHAVGLAVVQEGGTRESFGIIAKSFQAGQAAAATPASYDRPAPHFGRDTDRVLQDILGYDAPRIEALREAGALK